MPELLDFNSEIASMPEDQLNALFDGVDDVTGTVNAKDLKIGAEQVVDGTNVPELTEDIWDEVDKTPEEIAAHKEAELEKTKLEDKAKADEATKKEEAKAAAKKAEADKNKTPEQLAKEKEAADLIEKEKADKAKLEEQANSPVVVEALTNTVDYLVKQGLWVDFEGREDLKVTPEVYEQLIVAQDKLRLSAQFEELVDRTGTYGKAIIAHIEQGGNPDEIIDIFKEQKALEALPVTTESDKQVVIEKYYKDILGWKDDKIAKHVKRVIADDEVETEFKDVKELYDKHFQDQLEATDREAKLQQAKATQRQEEFKSSIKTALQKEDTLTPQERKVIEDSILNFKHDIGGGQRVNDFYIKFAEIQKDPAKYIQLVRFVMDPENYAKAIKQQAETKVTKKVFEFIKGNGAVTKTSSATDTNKGGGSAKSSQGTNFSFK